MTFATDDRVYETSTTTGTGTLTLLGAVTGYTSFSGMGNGNLCPYFITDGTNWEVGIGTIATGASTTLARTTVLRSSNADAAVDWGAGTRDVRCGWPADMAIPRQLSKSVAGSSDVTLTQDEQRRDQIILTGVLTGSISVIVDATKWRWSVYNNTTGAYTVTFKVTGAAGILVPQGARAVLESDGTNVVRVAHEEYIYLRDEKAANTAGGTFTFGAYRTRTINTEVSDEGGNASISSNVITLQPGTYRARWRCPATTVGEHKSRLANTSDTIEYYGSSEYSPTGTDCTNNSVGSARFRITAAKNFELQHFSAATKATNGFGVQCNMTGVEVYAEIEFWKEA